MERGQTNNNNNNNTNTNNNNNNNNSLTNKLFLCGISRDRSTILSVYDSIR